MANPPGPLDSPNPGALAQPSTSFDAPQVAATTIASGVPHPMQVQAPLPATQPHVGDPGTITVTATATMPQASMPPLPQSEPLPDGNYAVSVGDPPDDLHGWALVRFYMWKFGGTIIMERAAHGGEYVVGLGRLSFCLLFGLALWTWGHDKEIPNGAQDMLYVLLGYILGAGGLTVLQQLVTAKHGDPYAAQASKGP